MSIPSILIFAADHRTNINWDLPYIRVTDNKQSILNITQQKQLFKYRNILSEVSRIQYIYRNLNSFGKIDYIGFCHYRSFFAYMPNNNVPQVNTSDIKYLNNILSPVDQLSIISNNKVDGILNYPYPEIITDSANIVDWFKYLNNYLDYLHIPESLIDCCVTSILKYLPIQLKQYFINAQKNLNIYHANIFTIKIEIFKTMMQIFEKVFIDVVNHYEQTYANTSKINTFSNRWFGYLVEYLFTNTYFHAIQLAGLYKFSHCQLLKMV